MQADFSSFFNTHLKNTKSTAKNAYAKSNNEKISDKTKLRDILLNN